MTAGAGAAETVDSRGHPVLAGYAPMPVLGWVVVASIDTSTALAPLPQQELRVSLLQTLTFLLLIGFAIAVAILTTRPLGALSRAAASVEAGDPTARGPPPGGREVGVLRAPFNAIVERPGGVTVRVRSE